LDIAGSGKSTTTAPAPDSLESNSLKKTLDSLKSVKSTA